MHIAFGYYLASWFLIFFFKFIGSMAGVYFLVSPLSFLYSTLTFFTFFYFLNRKFNTEQDESTGQIICGVALFPYALILSTVLHWHGSYYCQRFFMKDGYMWPHPSDWEAGSYTLALMNGERERCLQDPFVYFGGFESSFNGWLLFLLLSILILALVAAIFIFFMTLKDTSFKEIIFELKHGGLTESEFKKKQNKRARIIRGIGKTGREVVNWKGKASDNMSDFHGKDSFLFFRANVLDIIEKEHLSKGDYLTWFGRMGEEYIISYSNHKDKYPKNQVIDQINWALSHLSEVYSGQSSATGKKREEKLMSIIKEIEML